MTIADRIQAAIDKAGSHFVSVNFIKKNGEPRQLTFNPRQVGEIKGTGRQCDDPDIFRIVEASKGQWRSFDAKRVVSIKVNKEVIVF
jgi:hypothetical protein